MTNSSNTVKRKQPPEKRQPQQAKQSRHAAQSGQKGQAGQDGQDGKNTLMQEIISWVEVIVVAVVLAWFLVSFIIINATVPSGSMENTIMPGNRLFGLRLIYTFGEPKRGDIAVFKYPVNDALVDELGKDKDGKAFLKQNKIKRVNYIKRVIGLPGETVEIRDAKIYINGSEEPLDESYLKEEWLVKNDGITFHVPEGHYLMLGDNRNNSSDARYWKEISGRYFAAAGVTKTDEELEALCYVPKKDMLGKAYLRYWPLNKISWLY